MRPHAPFANGLQTAVGRALPSTGVSDKSVAVSWVDRELTLSESPCVRLDRGVDRDELAGIVEDAYCTIAPKSLLAQAGLLEAED
jgi:hypothetical protein